MRRFMVGHFALVLVAVATTLPVSQPALAQNTGTAMPSDIDPHSGMRLPLPKREELDEADQKAYDRGTTPGATIAGLQGPSGIQLFSPKTAAHATALNRYLRYEAGFTGHVRGHRIHPKKKTGTSDERASQQNIGLAGQEVAEVLDDLAVLIRSHPSDAGGAALADVPQQARTTDLT